MTALAQALERPAMRYLPLIVLFLSVTLSAQEAGRPTFINAKVSAKQICLNEIVRLEFTTMPRDVENVDIAQSVANSLQLGAATTWRLVGKPIISEVLRGVAPTDEKAKTDRPKPVSVTVNLLPRTTGDLQLPDIPITWLQGNTIARFSIVTVSPQVMIIGTPRNLPGEVNGVGGFPWALSLDEARTRVDASKVKKENDIVTIQAQEQLTLNFAQNMFAGAELRAPGLTLAQAKDSFLQRWGVPHEESPTALTWILGWTRITAEPNPNGIVLKLQREDVTAQLSRSQVSSDIFGVLEGPQATQAELDAQRSKEVEKEISRPLVPMK
jgi:hypothetical protein